MLYAMTLVRSRDGRPFRADRAFGYIVDGVDERDKFLSMFNDANGLAVGCDEAEPASWIYTMVVDYREIIKRF